MMKKFLLGLFVFLLVSVSYASILKIETDVDNTIFLLKSIPYQVVVTLYSDEKRTAILGEEVFYREGSGNKNVYDAQIILKFDQSSMGNVTEYIDKPLCTWPMAATRFAFEFTDTNNVTVATRPWYTISFDDKHKRETPIAQVDQDAWETFIAKIEGTPVGTIIPWPTKDVPDGYLAADGSIVSRDAYPRLFAAIGTIYGEGDGETTFELPDLRGMFIRGLDNERGIDPKRSLGASQIDAFQDHLHAVGTDGTWSKDPAFNGKTGAHSVEAWETGVNGNSVVGTGTGLSSHLTSGYRTAEETRPINVALNYIIKY